MKLRPSDIFEKLSDLSGHELESELLRLCNSDSNLLADVRSLLAAHQQAGRFLKHSAGDSHQLEETSVHNSAMEQPGVMFGPYKLLEQIGEGNDMDQVRKLVVEYEVAVEEGRVSGP